MNTGRAMRTALAIATISLTISTTVFGQRQPATIPTAVAQAMAFDSPMFGRPRFFNGEPPTDWPASLIPTGATVLGGGLVGNPQQFRMRTTVFSFDRTIAPREAIGALLVRAGYARQDPPKAAGGGGFVSTNEPPSIATPYCKDGTLAVFSVVDSTQNPLVAAIALIDGDAGKQSCTLQSVERERGRFPVTIPTLAPPRGTVGLNGGSSWGGDEGTVRSSLRTTLSTDSVLMHYTTQLVAGGWVAEGKPAVAENVAVQRFAFSEGQERWTAALLITALDERRNVVLQLMKRD